MPLRKAKSLVISLEPFKYPNITKIQYFIQRYNSKYSLICPNQLIYHSTSLYSAADKTFGILVPDFFLFQRRRRKFEDFGRQEDKNRLFFWTCNHECLSFFLNMQSLKEDKNRLFFWTCNHECFYFFLVFYHYSFLSNKISELQI